MYLQELWYVASKGGQGNQGIRPEGSRREQRGCLA